MTRADLDQVGLVPGTRFELQVAGERYYATAARTYADARPGEIVLYEDSYRNVAIAINRGSAAEMLSRSRARASVCTWTSLDGRPAFRALRDGRRRAPARALAPLPHADAPPVRSACAELGVDPRAGRLAPLEAALDRLPSPPKRVLDVGTGTGAAARLVAARFPEADVTGVDVSERMLDEARGSPTPRASRIGRRTPERLPFDAASFDLVTLSNMIPFFDELARVSRRADISSSLTGGSERRSTCRRPFARRADRRGFAEFAELSAGRGTALLARRVNLYEHGTFTERCTVLDVPSRGGVIRPALFAP